MSYLLPQILSESASRWPDHEAVRFEGESLTYAQLDQLANQLARALAAEGVGPGDRVGIYTPKSFASIIGIFGILKAGGVYVPLDPNAPPRRLAYIASNCDIRVVVASSGKLDGLDAFTGENSPVAAAVLVNENARADDGLPADVETLGSLKVVSWNSVLAQEPSLPAVAGRVETDLAYILYTSGSTGVPKGVMISHRTIFTFINWCSDTFELTPDDRATSHAPLHFDLSTFDIFVTLKAGATLVLLPEKLSIFPVQIVRLFEAEKITVTYMVPSILSMMVNYGRLGDYDLSALRLVLFAGEVFPIKYLRALAEAIPHAAYYNLYGPTETNVCTYYEVQPEDLAPERVEPVPIGIACENMGAFALKDDGRLVTSPGDRGELWVRGSCVAQGYWGDPEKTDSSFLQNPQQPNFKETAYRTGDIVELDDRGINWLFIGRKDHMIKSRGYRIELGEIETTLFKHKAVQEAAVVAIPDDLIGNRLQAFVVPAEPAGLSAKEIREHCEKHLPKYMIPEKIAIMDALPKTSTGKVDRTILVHG